MGVILIIVSLVVVIALYDFWWIKFGGRNVAVPNIPRDTQRLGQGDQLRLLVLGDSTAVGQGADYDDGIVMAAAQHLAANHTVELLNVGVSGAVTHDVLTQQLPKVKDFKPDVVLLAVGSNDVTHFTNPDNAQKDMDAIVAGLIAVNCNTKIVLTGSAAMGSAWRIPLPLRWWAGYREKGINGAFRKVATARQVTLIPLADKTGDLFAHDRSLFAADKFHPNAKGYAAWSAVILPALDEALHTQPAHCQQ